jgi:hypothetical protein
MHEASEVAQEALAVGVNTCVDTDLSVKLGALVREVWATNIARHEPDELGDNARTLGFTCSENLTERVERRIRGHEHETERWDIDGLGVDKPSGALRLELNNQRFYLMKAPMAYGRMPQWDSLVSWDAESRTRQAIAQLNTRALGGWCAPAPGQEALWPILIGGNACGVRDFMIVWAGDAAAPLTAGWLTVPVLGDRPFAAVHRLWWDDDSDASLGTRRHEPDGPSFAEKPPIVPAVALKARPDRTGQL